MLEPVIKLLNGNAENSAGFFEADVILNALDGSDDVFLDLSVSPGFLLNQFF